MQCHSIGDDGLLPCWSPSWFSVRRQNGQWFLRCRAGRIDGPADLADLGRIAIGETPP